MTGRSDGHRSSKHSGKRGGKETDSWGLDDHGQESDCSDLSRKERKRLKRRARRAHMSLEEYIAENGCGGGSGRRSNRRDGGDGGSVSVASVDVERGSRRGGRGGVPATYHYYSPAYETSSLYCADAFAKRSGSSLLKHPWMAYCLPDGMSQDKCGTCARVTNLATGDSIKMLIVDLVRCWGCCWGCVEPAEERALRGALVCSSTGQPRQAQPALAPCL